jgi:hypothetical protein
MRIEVFDNLMVVYGFLRLIGKRKYPKFSADI